MVDFIMKGGLVMFSKSLRCKISLFLVMALLFWSTGLGYVYAENTTNEANESEEEFIDENSENDSGEEGIESYNYISELIDNLRTYIEEFRLYFIENPSKRAEAYLGLAEKRLIKANKFLDKNKYSYRHINRELNLYQKYMAKVEEILGEIDEDDLDKGMSREELKQIVLEATTKHLDVLAEVYNKVPEEAKEAILKAIEASKRGSERALEAIGKNSGLGKEGKEEEEIEEEIDENDSKDDIDNNDKANNDKAKGAGIKNKLKK